MFKSIFLFELKYWLKNKAFYIYSALFFTLALFLMMSAIGVFDSVKTTTSSMTHSNAPITLNLFINSINQMLYFLFPAIIGSGIYRDYKYNVHQILYSYSFSKSSYLLGKFLSAFVIVFLITVFIGLGLYVATLLPFANQELIGPNTFWNYAQVYLFNIIPNMLLIGMIVFAVTTLSRSVYVGFIVVIIVTILIGMVNSLATNIDNHVLAALLDPSGIEAIDYYTKYWTIDEYNSQNLPLKKWFLVNRAIWLSVSVLFLLLLAKLFTFSQAPLSFGRKAKGERVVKNNFVGLSRFSLPKVAYNFDLKSQLSNLWSFMKMEYKFLVRNVSFLILVGIGILLMVVVATQSAQMYGTNILPVTRVILEIPGATFQLFIIIVSFLGAGQLVHRGATTRMNGLIDATPVPNWVMFSSKFLALIFVQATLLMVIAVAGILIQIFQGYYHFELGLYLKSLLGVSWVWYIIWTGLALAVQTLFGNYLVGFIVLLAFFLFGNQITKIGIEQPVFLFNSLPTPSYSDLNGFGSGLPRYYTLALYWLLFIGFLSGLTVLFWRRGVVGNLKERIAIAKARATSRVILPTVMSLAGFIFLGGYLYYENKILNKYISSKDAELRTVEFEKKYKQYEDMILPRIVDIKIDLDLYPESRDFEARGTYLLKNKNVQKVDSILVRFNEELVNEISIEGAEFLSTDQELGFSFYRLKQPLDSGKTVELSFVTKNKPNTFIRTNSEVKGNGTFLNNMSFPALGYSDLYELQDNKVRKKYNLPEKERMASQDDLEARQNTYISNDADWVTFETTISTSKDQIAIAPGYLQKEWEEGNRKFYHYKMDRGMLNFYAFNSGRYEVVRDKWNDINIEIYHHRDHTYNIDRMIKGVKKGLDYCSENFSPYQHKQVRIIEFPATLGTFAQSFANTIPFSEAIGFIANVDDEDDDSVDYPFSITAHEVAHQWWAHQVIGANVQGATMLSESLAEYSSLKILEHEYGKSQMRKFLQDALNSYLSNRSSEMSKELPLMYNENQQYIHYYKGSLVFYAMSEYLGEKNLNKILSDYVKKVAFQEPPYTVSKELVDDLKAATPDSLQYLIHDMFETITLYDNYIDNASVEKLEGGRYKVDFSAYITKYRADAKGKRIFEENGNSLSHENDKGKEVESLPLNDYIEVGIFRKNEDEKEKTLYLQKVKITDIFNEFSIIVDEEPTTVGVDPYNMLIDTRSYDNRKSVSVK